MASCLPSALAFPAVQYLSQPQPQPYAVHSHFQPTQTGDGNTPCWGPVPCILPSSFPFSIHFCHSSRLGFLQPGGALSLQKQMEHANQQTASLTQ